MLASRGFHRTAYTVPVVFSPHAQQERGVFDMSFTHHVHQGTEDDDLSPVPETVPEQYRMREGTLCMRPMPF